jgi:hypothetical protein
VVIKVVAMGDIEVVVIKAMEGVSIKMFKFPKH